MMWIIITNKIINWLEEAEKTWALGKQNGLYVKNKDEVITALVKKKNLMKNEDQQLSMKQ